MVIELRSALLLPADGFYITNFHYSIKDKEDEDFVDSGMAEFYDPIPDLFWSLSLLLEFSTFLAQ